METWPATGELICGYCKIYGVDPRGPSNCHSCRALNEAMSAAWAPPAYVTGYCNRPHTGDEEMATRAITPAEAQAPSRDCAREVARHVKAINAMLKAGNRTYALSLISESQTRTLLIQEFMKSGWDVEWVSDQRDGDFLQFNAK